MSVRRSRTWTTPIDDGRGGRGGGSGAEEESICLITFPLLLVLLKISHQDRVNWNFLGRPFLTYFAEAGFLFIYFFKPAALGVEI